jgi:hypothetical protein
MNQSVFAIHDSPLYFEISEDENPPTHPQRFIKLYQDWACHVVW